MSFEDFIRNALMNGGDFPAPTVGEHVDYDPDLSIFLLMLHKNGEPYGPPRGFITEDGMRFAFAFTSREKAEHFTLATQDLGYLHEVNLIFEAAWGEYQQALDEGRINEHLIFNPTPDVVKLVSLNSQKQQAEYN
jgi:hypothetical protein